MIEVKITPNRGVNDETRRRLRKLARGVKDPTPVNRQISIWLLRWVNENFRSQGGKVGGWAPLKGGGRRRKGGGVDPKAKILQDTGRLRGSFHNFYNRKTAGVGSDLFYAPYHDLGAPRANIPQRRILPTSEDRDVSVGVLRIYEAYIRRITR